LPPYDLKSGQIQGNALYIEHTATGDVVLKSNAMTSLVVYGANTAYLSGKATVNGVGSYVFTLTAIDNGTPGTSDQLGLTVSSPSGTADDSLTFSPITLSGGKIVVPHPS